MAKYPIIVTRCKGSLQLSLQLHWVGVEAVGPVIIELLLFVVQDTEPPSLAPLGLLGLGFGTVLHLAVPADVLVNDLLYSVLFLLLFLIWKALGLIE